jgi:hypothetical protein
MMSCPSWLGCICLPSPKKEIDLDPKFAEAYNNRADLKEQKMQDRAGAI